MNKLNWELIWLNVKSNKQGIWHATGMQLGIQFVLNFIKKDK